MNKKNMGAYLFIGLLILFILGIVLYYNLKEEPRLSAAGYPSLTLHQVLEYALEDDAQIEICEQDLISAGYNVDQQQFSFEQMVAIAGQMAQNDLPGGCDWSFLNSELQAAYQLYQNMESSSSTLKCSSYQPYLWFSLQSIENCAASCPDAQTCYSCCDSGYGGGGSGSRGCYKECKKKFKVDPTSSL